MKKAAKLSWIAVWFGTVLVVQHDNFARNVGLAFWGVGILVQFVSSIFFFIGSGSNRPDVQGDPAIAEV